MAVIVVLALLAPAGLSGCSSESRSDDDKPAQSYTVRCEIKAVSVENKELQLHHEAIPDFTNAKGKQTGMMAMVMPFHVTDAVDITTLAAGDKVEIIFGTHWKKKPTLRITKLTKLPPETELEL